MGLAITNAIERDPRDPANSNDLAEGVATPEDESGIKGIMNTLLCAAEHCSQLLHPTDQKLPV